MDPPTQYGISSFAAEPSDLAEVFVSSWYIQHPGPVFLPYDIQLQTTGVNPGLWAVRGGEIYHFRTLLLPENEDQ